MIFCAIPMTEKWPFGNQILNLDGGGGSRDLGQGRGGNFFRGMLSPAPPPVAMYEPLQ
jgi:hypothetical protein